MASVTIQKWSTAAACGGQINHVYRTREHYGNRDIDTTLADCNEMAGTAEEARARIRETISQVDAATPPRRVRADRKTVAELCIPAPRSGMSDQDARRFLTAACIELVNTPGMHVVGIGLHGDEVHEYVNPDSKTRVQSRLHVHVLVVPDVPGRGCNMKSWLTKSRYREINQLLDRVCERELGYSYQDGTKSRSRGDVERVKAESLRAEAAELTAKIDTLRQEATRLDAIRQNARQDAARAAQEADRATTRAKAAEQAQRRSEAAQKASEIQVEAAEQRLTQLQSRADELREEIDRLDIVRELSTVPENRTLTEAKATARKTLMGDNVVLPRREFESICDLAETCWVNHRAVLQMQREKSDAERTAQQAEEQAERRARQISLDEARERAGRDARLGRYERMEREFPQVFQEMDERMHTRTIDHDRGRSR
jgi:outer membrane murein-binding lipoprotein Lpp